MTKKTIYFLIVLTILVTSFFVIKNYLKRVNNNTTTTTTTLSQIGGNKDSHGCLVGAGYQWCESSHECQRLWEGKCNPDFIKTVTFVDTKDGLVIYYEEPGKPALTKSFIFDNKCAVNNKLCKSLDIPTGSVSKVQGITLDDYILITSLEF